MSSAKVVRRAAQSSNASTNHEVADVVKIYCTMDYSRFVLPDQNRQLGPAHVTKIKESITQHGYLKERPIDCIEDGDSLIVIDGQHRLAACRDLKEPIYYVVKEGTLQQTASSIRVINAYAKGWREADFLRHFTAIGSKSYIALSAFMTSQDLPIRSAIGLLATGGEMISKRKELAHDFKIGTLAFDAAAIARADEIMTPVNEVRNFHDRFSGLRRQAPFINALIILTSDKHYEHDRFMKNLAMNISMLVHCTSVARYLSIFESIYNYRRKDGTRINLTTRGIAFIRHDEAGTTNEG